MFGFVAGGGMWNVCSVENNPPGRRVVISDLLGILHRVAVYWRLPGATGDDPQGKWFDAAVNLKSANSRKGKMKITYLEDDSEDEANIDAARVVWIADPVGNLEAEEDAMRNDSEGPGTGVGPIPGRLRGSKCEHGK